MRLFTFHKFRKHLQFSLEYSEIFHNKCCWLKDQQLWKDFLFIGTEDGRAESFEQQILAEWKKTQF